MKILHIGDVAGVPQKIAQAQRELGYKSDVLSYKMHPFGYQTDFCYPVTSKFPYDYIKRFTIFLKFIKKYDIYHFHGVTLLPKGIDSILWKMIKKKLIIHHHGSELRFKGENYIYSKFADKILVSTPDLLEWSPDGIWLPNPVDIREYELLERGSQTHKLRILHAPSSRETKGTKYVIQAINKLKKEGYDIEFILLENVPHEEVLEQTKLSDIIVDQLIIGWYGMFSIEAMCMGKPVLCYIKKDLADKYYQDLPILNTSPEFVYENLIKLIENPKLRTELGVQGRKYVERKHDSRGIAKSLIDLYTK
jgi:glycosyltransferase involved in cell wall biosynthesis